MFILTFGTTCGTYFGRVGNLYDLFEGCGTFLVSTSCGLVTSDFDLKSAPSVLVMQATFLSILVFLKLFVLELGADTERDRRIER